MGKFLVPLRGRKRTARGSGRRGEEERKKEPPFPAPLSLFPRYLSLSLSLWCAFGGILSPLLCFLSLSLSNEAQGIEDHIKRIMKK